MTGNSQECYWCESEMACVDSDTFTSMPLSECRTTAFDLAQCKTDRHESTLGLGSTFNWGNLFQGGDSAEVGTLAPDPETGDEVTNEAEEVSRVTSPPSAPPTPVPAAGEKKIFAKFNLKIVPNRLRFCGPQHPLTPP